MSVVVVVESFESTVKSSMCAVREGHGDEDLPYGVWSVIKQSSRLSCSASTLPCTVLGC